MTATTSTSIRFSAYVYPLLCDVGLNVFSQSCWATTARAYVRMMSVAGQQIDSAEMYSVAVIEQELEVILNALKTTRGLALADIITALSEELAKLEVAPEVMISWLDGLADIEHRVAAGGSEMVQTGAVVGVVRGGVELMSR